jgi:hypothetical protein
MQRGSLFAVPATYATCQPGQQSPSENVSANFDARSTARLKSLSPTDS